MTSSDKFTAYCSRILLFASVFFCGCKKDNTAVEQAKPLPGTLAYIQKEPRFSLLSQALTRSGLDKVLPEGNVTVFAPNDSAFIRSGWTKETINRLTPDSIRFVLSYHIAPGIIGSENIAGFYKTFPLTLNENYKPNIVKNYYGLFFNGNHIDHANLKMGDGLIHEMQAIAFPPTADLLSTLYNQPELTIFSAMVKRFSILRNAIQKEDLTLLVPVDKAFLDSGYTLQSVNNPDTVSLIKRCWAYIGSLYQGRLYTTDYLGTGKFFRTDALIIPGSSSVSYRYYISTDGKEIQPSYDDLIRGTSGIVVAPKLIRQNILSRGGIIHTVDLMFKPLK